MEGDPPPNLAGFLAKWRVTLCPIWLILSRGRGLTAVANVTLHPLREPIWRLKVPSGKGFAAFPPCRTPRARPTEMVTAVEVAITFTERIFY